MTIPRAKEERDVISMQCPKCRSKRLIPCIDGRHQHCRDCGHIFAPSN